MIPLLPLVSRRKPIKEDPDNKNREWGQRKKPKKMTLKVSVNNRGEEGFEEELRE